MRLVHKRNSVKISLIIVTVGQGTTRDKFSVSVAQYVPCCTQVYIIGEFQILSYNCAGVNNK